MYDIPLLGRYIESKQKLLSKSQAGIGDSLVTSRGDDTLNELLDSLIQVQH